MKDRKLSKKLIDSKYQHEYLRLRKIRGKEKQESKAKKKQNRDTKKWRQNNSNKGVKQRHKMETTKGKTIR